MRGTMGVRTDETRLTKSSEDDVHGMFPIVCCGIGYPPQLWRETVLTNANRVRDEPQWRAPYFQTLGLSTPFLGPHDRMGAGIDAPRPAVRRHGVDDADHLKTIQTDITRMLSVRKDLAGMSIVVPHHFHLHPLLPLLLLPTLLTLTLLLLQKHVNLHRHLAPHPLLPRTCHHHERHRHHRFPNVSELHG